MSAAESDPPGCPLDAGMNRFDYTDADLAGLLREKLPRITVHGIYRVFVGQRLPFFRNPKERTFAPVLRYSRFLLFPLYAGVYITNFNISGVRCQIGFCERTGVLTFFGTAFRA